MPNLTADWVFYFPHYGDGKDCLTAHAYSTYTCGVRTLKYNSTERPADVLKVARELQLMALKRLKAAGIQPEADPEYQRILFVVSFLLGVHDDS